MKTGHTRKRSFYKKRRVTNRYAVVAKTATSIPRQWFRTMPAEMNIAVTNTQQLNYEVDNQGFARFIIPACQFLGINAQYPPYFIDLMRIYSSARPRKAFIDLQFIARLAPDNSNNGLNIACGVLNGGDAALMANSQTNMNKLRSLPNSSTHYLGSFAGGSSVIRIVRSVDVDKFFEGGVSIDCSTRTVYNNDGVLNVIQPTDEALSAAPTVVCMYTPIQQAAFQFQIIRKITYHITFSGLHLGSQINP